MKYFFVFFMLLSTQVAAQVTDTTTKVLFLNEQFYCPLTRLHDFARKDTTLAWDNIEYMFKDMLKEEFDYLVHDIKRKTKFSNIFDNSLCVLKSVVSTNEDSFHQVYVEIYEIAFDYEYQCKNFMKVVKKYKVDTWDWPDASLPLQFFTKGRSVFIFVDANEEYGEPAVFNKFVQYLKNGDCSNKCVFIPLHHGKEKTNRNRSQGQRAVPKNAVTFKEQVTVIWQR